MVETSISHIYYLTGREMWFQHLAEQLDDGWTHQMSLGWHTREELCVTVRRNKDRQLILSVEHSKEDMCLWLCDPSMLWNLFSWLLLSSAWECHTRVIVQQKNRHQSIVRKTGIRLWDCPRKNPWLLPRQQHWCCSRASLLRTVSTPPCDSQHMKRGFAITLLNSTVTLAFKACFDISAAWHSSPAWSGAQHCLLCQIDFFMSLGCNFTFSH